MPPSIQVEGFPARHGFFTRAGGVSEGAYASLNCSARSEDAPERVAENRRRVAAALGGELVGVRQVHGADCVVCEAPWADMPAADALATRVPGLVLGVLTADCGPVLFADREAGVVAAAHAGWRGALAGVLEATIATMEGLGARREAIIAAVGPCIAQASYEVAADMRDEVLAREAADARFFADGARAGRWQFDLAGYCAARVASAGVNALVVGRDTAGEPNVFFSHRRRVLAGGGPLGHQISAIASFG